MKLVKCDFSFIYILLFLAITHASFGQDFDRPILSSAVVSPSYVDVSSGGVTVTVSVQVSDATELSYNNTVSKGGYINPYNNILNSNQWLDAFTLVSGDQFNGIYESTIYIDPSNVPSNTYSVRIYETNWRDQGGLTPQSISNPSLQVRNNYPNIDFDRPVLSSAVVSPSYVDVSSGGVTVTVSVQVSDATELSYNNTVSKGGYIDPYNNILNSNQWLDAFTLVSGDQFNGIYESTIYIDPSNVPSNTYSVRIYETNWRDQGGLTPQSISNPSLQVRNNYSNIDFDRPVLSSAVVSPSYVDVSSGGVTVTVSVQVSDATELSYNNTVSKGGYIDPYNNILNSNQWLDAFTLVSGDQFNGIYESTIYIDPSNVPSNTYSVRIYETNWRDQGGLTPQSISNPSLQVRNNPNLIYFENGTCKCPNSSAGVTSTINGVVYTVVDNSTIQEAISSGNLNLCTTLVTDMVELFRDNSSFNSEIGFWDTSNVTNMTSIFRGAESFNQEINRWDVSNVIDMTDMFGYAINFNKDISSWDISNVTLMTYMFRGAENFNQNIGGWDVSNVTNMFHTFTGAENFNQDISGWNTSNVTDMTNLFHNAFDFNQNIGGWDVSNVTDMSGMFKGASSFNQDLNDWDVSNVTEMNDMFKGASSFNQDLNDWDVSSVENISGMFWDANSFNGQISNWDTSSVVNMSLLFEGAAQFNQPIGGWNTSNVQSFQSVFFGASLFNQDISDWNTSSSNDMAAMFNSAQSFNKDIGDWDVSNVTQMTNMFIGATSFNQDLSDWCVSNITSEPAGFSTNSALVNENKPLWGSCNNSPVAILDQISVLEGGVATTLSNGATSLLANDSDADGDSLTASLVIAPLYHQGSFSLQSNGAFLYIHDGSETVTDSFIYQVSDGESSVQATAVITINRVNDCPILVSPITDINLTEDAPDTLINLTAIFNDSDLLPTSDILSYTVTHTNASLATVTLNSATLTISYKNNQSGSMVVTVTADDNAGCDSTLDVFNVMVMPINDAPIGVEDQISVVTGGTVSNTTANASSVLANDSDPEGDPLVAALISTPINGSLNLQSDGTFLYAHDGSATSTDSFSYRTSDGFNQSNVVVVTINIIPSYSQDLNADLELGNRSRIIDPPPGSVAQYCSDTGSNLRFRVVNRSSGASNVIDLNANNLVATLTLTGNTFSPSGTVTSATFNVAASSNASSTQYIGASGFAEFQWPTALQFNGTGTTTVNVEVAVIGNTDSVSGNNSTSYQINVLPNPTPPTITTNFGASTINICPSDTVIITSSTVGNEYEFYRNSVLLGPRQTSNQFTINTLNDGDVVEVKAFFTNSCSSASASLTIQTNAISTIGTITTTTTSACLGDTIPPLTGSAGVASGTVSYQWQSRNQTTSDFTDIVGATSQNYTPTTVLATDTFFRRTTISTLNSLVCEDYSNVVRVLIDTAPVAILSVNNNGVVITASATATTCFGEELMFIATTIPGASYEFLIDNVVVQARADSNVYTTTALLAGDQVKVRVYDRLTAAAPAGCSADSEVFTIAIAPVPTLTVTSSVLGNEICSGDEITFFANASIAGSNYEFYINGVSYQGVGSSQSFDPLAYGVPLEDGDIIEVIASTGIASCSSASASLTITLNQGPSPEFNLVTTGGGDRTLCASETIIPIRYEINNQSGVINASWNVTPTGIVYQNYYQNQVTEFNITQIGALPTTISGDVFSFNVNGTIYRAITNGASSTLNINALTATLGTWLNDVLANHNVSSNGSTLTFEAINPGVAFTVTTSSSSTFSIGTGETVRPPSYFEISGTASNSTNSIQSYVYTLTSSGTACIEGSTASGTISVNPITSGTFISSSNQTVTDSNPFLCDGSGLSTLRFSAPNAIAVSLVASSPSWITATKVGSEVVVDINVPSLGMSLPSTYTYGINLIGNPFGCSTSLTSIYGILTVEPSANISIVQGSNVATYCGQFQDLTGQNAIILEYENATALVIDPSTPLPNGLTFGLNQGSFDQYAISGQLNQTVTQTTIWDVVINTIGANCSQVSQTISFILYPQPVLNLSSQPNSENQIICSSNAIDPIIYELGTGTDNVQFTWTSGASSVLGLTTTLNASRTEFTISGTPMMNVTQTTSYGYQIETIGSNCSPEVVLTGLITITPPSNPGTIVGSQTIGSGNIPAQLTGTVPAGVSTPTYQWESGSSSATFIDIAGATQQNYTPTALTSTTFFRRKVSNAGGCEAFSNVVKIEVDTEGPSVVGIEITDNTTVTLEFNEPVFADANQSNITTAKFRFTTQTGSITLDSPTPSSIEFIEENKIVLGVDITGSTNATQTLVINILGLLYDAAGNSLPISEIIQTVQFELDDDLDGVLNQYDQCPDTPFGEQADVQGCSFSQRDDDGDGVNNGIDECPNTIEVAAVNEVGCALYQLDEDLDGVLNEIDQCPDTPFDETANEEGCSPSQIDTDEDGVPDFLDNCPEVANPEQTDADGDGKGDVCDPDPAIAVVIFELGEDAEPGTYVGEINAVDKDGLPVDVTIDSPAELFVLESTSIILNGELDYETAIEHEIQVFAVSERGSSNTFVTIPVSDVPNATYTGNFFITVFDVQNEQLGSKVDYTRYFNDNDKGVGKWKIKKKITGGNDAHLFRIEEISDATDKIEDENTGILAFINPPDFEDPQDHNQDNIYEVEVTYVNTEDGEPEVPIPTTQFNLTVPENAMDAIELQSYPALPTDDTDGDGVPDVQDNSPVNYNPDQTDTDGDGVGDASDDADHDGVWDPYDTCPDTPMGERVDLDGCIQFYLPTSNFSISKTEKCRDTNSISISAAAQEYTYNLAVSGATTLSDSFAGTTNYTLNNLSGGLYSVCLTVEGYDASEYQRCFDILIEEPQPLSVYASKAADSETVNFSLKGGQVYNITHNGKTVQTDQSNYAIKLDKGNNVINISTGIECQGVFEQTYFNSASIVLAPNPIKEMLYVYVGGEDTDVVISIYASNGVVIHTARYSLDASRTVPLEVGQLQQGSYVVKAQGNTINTSELLIKE